MKTKTSKILLLLLFSVVSILAILIVGQAQADTLNYTLDVTMTGTTPSGNPTAFFDDSEPGANTVRLTMNSGGLSGTEGILQWYFNFDPEKTASLLTLTYVSGAMATTTDINENNLKADGDGYFDFAFRFLDEPNGLGPDSNDLTSVYDITYTSVIDVNSFNFFSASGTGTGTGLYLSAAQVNDINGDDQDSGWVGVVPEPLSSALFLIGGATLGVRRYFRKKK
jgi:hypothetical protein